MRYHGYACLVVVSCCDCIKGERMQSHSLLWIRMCVSCIVALSVLLSNIQMISWVKAAWRASPWQFYHWPYLFAYYKLNERLLEQMPLGNWVSPGLCLLSYEDQHALGVACCQAIAANNLRFQPHSTRIGLYCSSTVPEPWVCGSKVLLATKKLENSAIIWCLMAYNLPELHKVSAVPEQSVGIL